MSRHIRGLVAVGALAALSITPVAATAASAAGVVHSPAHVIGRVHNIQQSTNWSGYVETGGTYSSITGAWGVPAVKSSSGKTYSSAWIGIDGDGNSDLIQTGTEADYINGKAKYDAWWEILPAAETVIPSITVHPHDVFAASVVQQSGSSWKISIRDVTDNQSFTTTQTYSGPGASAEWIVERPEVGLGLSTLANYGTITFNQNDTLNGANPDFTPADEMEMTNSLGTKVISTPSAPNAETNGFRTAYGSTAPSPPA